MKIKRKRWTKGEEKYVIENCGKMTYEEMAKKLNRTVNSIKQKTFFLRRSEEGMKKATKYQHWTIEEEEKLIELYETMKPKQICKMLNRPLNSINSKIHSMGLWGGDIGTTKVSEEQERLDRQSYVQVISEPVIAGVYKSDVKVKVGQSYQIENMKKRTRQDKYFIGKVIQETKDHITVKNKARTESFLKVDFLIGEYKIKEVA